MHELLSPRSPKECVLNSEAKQVQLHIISLQKCHPKKKEEEKRKIGPNWKRAPKKSIYSSKRKMEHGEVQGAF